MNLYYRCYLIGRDNRFKDVVEFFCPDGEAAIVRARSYLDCQPEFIGVEVWEGAHRVYSYLRSPPDSVPGSPDDSEAKS